MEPTSIYMDYQATTPLEPDVLDSVSSALKDAWGNPSSSHLAGVKAKNIIDEARRWVAQAVGAKDQDIIFNSGGTEGNNTILRTAIKYFYDTYMQESKTPHIITSNVEHDSIEKPLKYFEREKIAEVTFIPVSHKTGRVEIDDVLAAIRDTTVLITIMLANNETGIIMPIKEISEAVSRLKRPRPILLHTDAAQAMGKIPVDVNELGVDYLTIVGHKFYGPRIGALYVKDLEKRKTPCTPLVYGGGQERNFRSGTENTGMVAGLGKAAELVCLHLEDYQKHQKMIRDYLESKLLEVFGSAVHFNGKFEGVDRLPNVCNFSIEGKTLKGYEVLSKCKRVQASVGAACHSSGKLKASHILLNTGIEESIAKNAIRLSVGRGTTKHDVDAVVLDIKQAVETLQSIPVPS